MLPALIRSVEATAWTCPSRDVIAVSTVRAQVYQAAAMVLSRVGETGLAWTAGDRAVTAAEHANAGLLAAVSAFRLAHVFIRRKQAAQAYGLVSSAASASQVSLDLARAYAQQRYDAAAVNMLMSAEQAAPQLVRYDTATHDLLAMLLRREHRASTPQLRPLARRAGVI